MQANIAQSTFANYGVTHITVDEPLAPHTTWRIGGPADVFVVPHSVEELRGAVLATNQLGLPRLIIGKGSNLLVQDGGIRGVVIKLGDKFSEVTIEGTELVAMAGKSYISVGNIAIKNNLQGLEFATGIPGSVGGAVMMNAGAHGSETKDVLAFADVMDDSGEVRRFDKEALQFGYRHSILKDDPTLIAVAAGFVLRPGDQEEMTKRRTGWTLRRSSTQPLSKPNCGSVFRNPVGTHAGYLIESAGLKGLRRGDAQISPKHANFIVNLGHATAADVLWLMHHAQETVRAIYGIDLETEVRIVGEPASGR